MSTPNEDKLPLRKRGMKWSDLDPAAQAVIVAIGIGQVLEKLAMWHSLYHRPASKIRGPKWVWFLLSWINEFGPLAYLIYGRKK